MDINITLIGELLTFGVLLWVVSCYIWPSLMGKLKERQQKILQGMENFDKSHVRLLEADQQASLIIQDAKDQAGMIINQARKQAELALNEAKLATEKQQKQLVMDATKEAAFKIEKLVKKMRAEEVERLMLMLEKILDRKLTDDLRRDFLDQAIEQIK